MLILLCYSVTLQFRVYAIYDKNKKLAGFNTIVFLVKILAGVGVYIGGVHVGISECMIGTLGAIN